MSSPKITDFLANLDKHKGLAKTERFYVQITPPQSLEFNNNYDLQFQTEAAEIPGLIVEAIKYRFYGPERNLALSKRFDEIMLGIICTNDFYEKPFFDDWLDLVQPEYLGWDLNYKSVYVGTLTIFQIDQAENVIYSINLVNAWPSRIMPLQTRWNDDTYHKLNITFLYDRYETIQAFNNLNVKFDSLSNSLSNNLNGIQNPFAA